jgi:hypothetical protein
LEINPIQNPVWQHLDSAGIEHGKHDAVPLRVGLQSVTRGARDVVYYSQTLANQPVEKRRFTHIGAAHKSNNWFSHLHS